MIRVTVLRDSLGIKTVQGTIEFFSIPVRNRNDYRCSKPNLLPLEQVERIADELSRGLTEGQTNGLEWRKE